MGKIASPQLDDDSRNIGVGGNRDVDRKKDD